MPSRSPRSVLAFLSLLFTSLPAFAQHGVFRPQRLLPPQRPITEFPIKSAREAWDLLNPAELVLGVEVNGEARAYPINMLTGPRREILNDSLGARPIAATW